LALLLKNLSLLFINLDGANLWLRITVGLSINVFCLNLTGITFSILIKPILRTSPSILSKPSKSILAKSKFYLKTKSFVQITKDNTKNIPKIKKMFSKLSNNKIIKIHNIAYKNDQKAKSKINMTIKELLRKQIIIPISRENINVIVIVSDINTYIANIIRLLKFIKSDVSANFICYDNKDIIITTNKMAVISNMNIIKKYIKKLDNINSNNVMCPCLPQFKFKILGVLYYLKNMFSPITYN